MTWNCEVEFSKRGSRTEKSSWYPQVFAQFEAYIQGETPSGQARNKWGAVNWMILSLQVGGFWLWPEKWHGAFKKGPRRSLLKSAVHY